MEILQYHMVILGGKTFQLSLETRLSALETLKNPVLIFRCPVAHMNKVSGWVGVKMWEAVRQSFLRRRRAE